MKRLPVLPPMACDDGCGDCCGLVPVSDSEFARIERFVAERNIKPLDQGVTCPFFQAGRWSPFTDLVPLVHGLSGGMVGRRRRARIRALGNTVVPQCAEVAGWVIRELIAARAA